MLFDMRQDVPVYGSLDEAMFLLVWHRRQVIKAAEIKTVAQASLGGSEAEDAYADFLQKLTNAKDTAGDFLMEQAKKLLDEGPVYVIPISQ